MQRINTQKQKNFFKTKIWKTKHKIKRKKIYELSLLYQQQVEITQINKNK